jgi:uncharacterized membrane protein
MTDQRYAPPLAALAEPRLRQGSGGQIDIGEAFREAWAAVWPNLGLLMGAALVSAGVALISVFTIVGIFLVLPLLTWGWWRLMLNVLDGSAELKDVFGGFERYRENLSAVMGLSMLMLLIALVGQSLQNLGQFLHSMPLLVFGTLVSVVWSFGFMPRFAFVWYFLVDQQLQPAEAVRACWDATANQKLSCFVIGLVSWLVMLVGFLFLVVGVIPGAFVASLMQAAAYRQLVGR